MYDLFMERPAPLAPRELRFELDERILADGSIHRLLEREEVTRLIETLRADGIEALAVCLLHSYRNPSQERLVGELAREHAPEMACSLSCEVVPEIRECDRASTTLVNVYIQRIAERYLASLEARLQAIGVEGALFIMQSNGGVCDVETARRFPVRLAESGPAAGALAAAHYLGEYDRLGSVSEGKLADLVVLKGDPIANPADVRNTTIVFKDGVGYDAPKILESILYYML